MSASQFPLHRASPMNFGHPVLKAGEMRHVAAQLARLEVLLTLAVSPVVSALDRSDVLTEAHQLTVYLTNYTQPWIVEHE
jgi:hypothetical protein